MMSKAEYQALEAKHKELVNRKSLLVQKLTSLKSQDMDLRKKRQLGENVPASKLDKIQAEISDTYLDLVAIDEVIVDALEQYKPFEAFKERFKAILLRQKAIQDQDPTDPAIAALNSELSALEFTATEAIRRETNIRIESLESNLDSLQVQANPLSNRIAELKSELEKLESNPVFSELETLKQEIKAECFQLHEQLVHDKKALAVNTLYSQVKQRGLIASSPKSEPVTAKEPELVAFSAPIQGFKQSLITPESPSMVHNPQSNSMDYVSLAQEYKKKHRVSLGEAMKAVIKI